MKAKLNTKLKRISGFIGLAIISIIIVVSLVSGDKFSNEFNKLVGFKQGINQIDKEIQYHFTGNIFQNISSL